jgi:carbonic anhydrase
VQDVVSKHEEVLSTLDEDKRLDRLCELNVIEQVLSVGRTTIVQSAWQRGQELVVHGWIYGLEDGLLRDLGVSIGV